MAHVDFTCIAGLDATWRGQLIGDDGDPVDLTAYDSVNFYAASGATTIAKTNVASAVTADAQEGYFVVNLLGADTGVAGVYSVRFEAVSGSRAFPFPSDADAAVMLIAANGSK